MITDTRPKAEQYGAYAKHDLAKFRACLTMKASGRNISDKTLDTWERRVIDWAVRAAHEADRHELWCDCVVKPFDVNAQNSCTCKDDSVCRA